MNGAARVWLSAGMRLQWEAAQSAYVMLYPEGMIKLNEPAGEILGMLEGLVNGYNIPIARAERSARIQYGEKEPRVIEDPDLPKKYGWER